MTASMSGRVRVQCTATDQERETFRRRVGVNPTRASGGEQIACAYLLRLRLQRYMMLQIGLEHGFVIRTLCLDKAFL
jgi:hypothetical protein